MIINHELVGLGPYCPSSRFLSCTIELLDRKETIPISRKSHGKRGEMKTSARTHLRFSSFKHTLFVVLLIASHLTTSCIGFNIQLGRLGRNCQRQRKPAPLPVLQSSSADVSDNKSSPIPFVSSSFLPKTPLGTMSVKYKRNTVAILPCCGDLSSVLYGVTQRAAAIYDSGIEGNKKGSPRGVAATSRGSLILNKALSSKFNLAYAGEDKVRLADLSCEASVGRVLKGYDVVFCGLGMNQRRGKVTGNTYETGPNDTCVEYSWDGVIVADGDSDFEENINLLRRIVGGCAAGTHLVVVGTGVDELDREGYKVLKALKGGGPNFTLIIPSTVRRMEASLGVGWTYNKGLGDVLVARELLGGDLDDWDQGKYVGGGGEEDNGICCEDLAIFALSSAMQLDPGASRVVQVKATGCAPPVDQGTKSLTKPEKTDKMWCRGQQYVMSMIENCL
jgi:hypothetical protein